MVVLKKLISLLPFINFRTNLIIEAFNLNRNKNYVWGMKNSGLKIRNKKNKNKNFKISYLEDGFIHSFGTKKAKIPLSICNDSKGIYYDYKSNSDLFSLIKEKLSDEEILRSRKIILLWKRFGVSKYNYTNFLIPPKKPFVLLIDQTFGDLSITYGGADVSAFQRMFEFAKKKWPDLMIVIKLHPEVISKRKKGYLDKAFYTNKNVIIINENGQLNDLIKSCTALCVVTSQVGFEGLIYEKEVHVFGNPFYSGLGLTIDHCLLSKRKKLNSISLEQLVLSTLVKYPTYLDPRNKKICEIEKIIEYLYKKRKINKFFPENLYCLGLTPWKSRQINKYLKETNGLRASAFVKYKKCMKNVLVWGKSKKFQRILINTKKFITVEDGFIRSVGLGGDLFPPMSLVFDKKGIHYDYKNPSNLEDLLQTRILNDQELIRSSELIKKIKNKKISKYNLIHRKNFVTKYAYKTPKKKTILVLGQVETDNSMIYGVPDGKIKKTNYSLLLKVKKDYPNYHIIYKPHPDIEKGLRSKGLDDDLIENIADSLAYKTGIEDLFSISDRVAVFTSLAGFEALLRKIPVTCYGFPFYSGWGLTEDKYSNKLLSERRTRNLTLEELVYISLIEYPYYFSLKFNCIMEIEDIINEIELCRNEKKNIEQIIFRYWGILKDFLKKKEFFR